MKSQEVQRGLHDKKKIAIALVKEAEDVADRNDFRTVYRITKELTCGRKSVKGLLGEKALITSLEPMCSLEIRDLDCLTERVEVEEAIKRECPEVTNVRIGIISVLEAKSSPWWKFPSNMRGNSFNPSIFRAELEKARV